MSRTNELKGNGMKQKKCKVIQYMYICMYSWQIQGHNQMNIPSIFSYSSSSFFCRIGLIKKLIKKICRDHIYIYI